MTQASIPRVPVQTVQKTIQEGQPCQIIDVREYPEYAAEKIAGAVLVPLSSLRKKSDRINKDVPAYIFCTAGVRAANAAQKLAKWGFTNTVVIEGGMNAWMKAGFPVERGTVSTWAIERQVRFMAGSLIGAGSLLGWFVHPGFLGIPLFVGLGLVYSAVTNTCGMALMLLRMPWNREPKEN